MLFLKPDAVRMPGKCCLLAVSPLLRELLSRLATYPATQPPPPHVYLPLVSLLLSEMEAMPSQNFYLPLSPESRLRRIAEMLTNNPGDRATMKEWARRAATSERTLARLVKQEIGMTFGRWRTQMHIVVALQRLSEGAKVQTVANDLGYESLSSFTIMFKKHLGKSPVKFVHNFIDIDAAEPSLSKSIPLSQADPK